MTCYGQNLRSRAKASTEMSLPEELQEIEKKLLPLFQNGYYQEMEVAANDMLKGVESRGSSEREKAYLLTRRGQAKYMQVKLNETLA